MVSETFVVLTKMALEIQPQFTYGFIGLRSCILGLKKKKFHLYKIKNLLSFFSQSTTLCILHNLCKEFL